MPTVSEKRIDDDVRAVLKQGEWTEDGLGFVMPQMSRQLYEKTSKVLTSLGGKWNRKAKATLFEDTDAVQSLLEAVETGVYVDLKKAFQQFDTPDDVAELLMDALELRGQEGLRFLEPSVGTGQLIRAILRREARGELRYPLVVAVELDEKRFDDLATVLKSGKSSVTMSVLKAVHGGDFLETTPQQLSYSPGRRTNRKTKPEEVQLFDRVAMNPPFTKSQDMRHVLHAINFLKPGGILAAIMSPGFTFRMDKLAVQFREQVLPHGGYELLPAGMFREAGTTVRTCLLTYRKPL